MKGRDYFFRRTPGPPPFLFINIMPALSKVLAIISNVAMRGRALFSSMEARLRSDTLDISANVMRDHPSNALAARIWAGVIIASFMHFGLDAIPHDIAQYVQMSNVNNHEEANMASKEESKSVTIPAPRFGRAKFTISGDVLVIHRFSAKTKQQMKQKMETGKAAGSRKNREAKATDDLFQEARYVSKEGWDGFHAAAIRNAMISACRLVGFKMTLAKLSIFVEADGCDAAEPQIPLIRIKGKPIKQEDMARVETGQPYVTVRAAYFDWSADVKLRWDEDQFTLEDISNLLSRVGAQVGICEGRPDSPNSAGMGWGLFEVAKTPKAVAA